MSCVRKTFTVKDGVEEVDKQMMFCGLKTIVPSLQRPSLSQYTVDSLMEIVKLTNQGKKNGKKRLDMFSDMYVL